MHIHTKQTRVVFHMQSGGDSFPSFCSVGFKLPQSRFSIALCGRHLPPPTTHILPRCLVCRHQLTSCPKNNLNNCLHKRPVPTFLHLLLLWFFIRPDPQSTNQLTVFRTLLRRSPQSVMLVQFGRRRARSSRAKRQTQKVRCSFIFMFLFFFFGLTLSSVIGV